MWLLLSWMWILSRPVISLLSFWTTSTGAAPSFTVIQAAPKSPSAQLNVVVVLGKRHPSMGLTLACASRMTSEGTYSLVVASSPSSGSIISACRMDLIIFWMDGLLVSFISPAFSVGLYMTLFWCWYVTVHTWSKLHINRLSTPKFSEARATKVLTAWTCGWALSKWRAGALLLWLFNPTRLHKRRVCSLKKSRQVNMRIL